MPAKKPAKIDKVRSGIDKAQAAAELGKQFAPPGVRGRIQDAEDAMELAETGLSMFERLKGLFRRKK